ncbi:hypothetical protein LOK49_LG04G03112 [Camellia lanceoleosa]|uniref:Uncharacterized protein n=1 Tax=Camellia lanceoleosa TaxID=1840588 RepID=A0ACC0I088_9ERIC|nr:hypothetical protein LOK49_LG04G03112 [Camellia lanceoleosa]
MHQLAARLAASLGACVDVKIQGKLKPNLQELISLAQIPLTMSRKMMLFVNKLTFYLMDKLEYVNHLIHLTFCIIESLGAEKDGLDIIQHEWALPKFE